MIISKFKHKALRSLYETDNGKGLPTASIGKIKRILAALEFADTIEQVATLPGWKLHPLKGERSKEYSITVTGNWRITFLLEDNIITQPKL